jgi:hypothetical protein
MADEQHGRSPADPNQPPNEHVPGAAESPPPTGPAGSEPPRTDAGAGAVPPSGEAASAQPVAPAGPPPGGSAYPPDGGGAPGPSRWDRFGVWSSKRPVQLVAVGLAGAIVGGALVGFFEAIGHDGSGRHGFYGRDFGPRPYMRQPGLRMRQWDGVPPWQQGGPGGPAGPGGPRIFRSPAAPTRVPTATATVTVTPSPTGS